MKLEACLLAVCPVSQATGVMSTSSSKSHQRTGEQAWAKIGKVVGGRKMTKGLLYRYFATKCSTELQNYLAAEERQDYAAMHRRAARCSGIIALQKMEL